MRPVHAFYNTYSRSRDAKPPLRGHLSVASAGRLAHHRRLPLRATVVMDPQPRGKSVADPLRRDAVELSNVSRLDQVRPPHTHFRPSNTSPPTPKRPPLTARVPRRRRSQRARSSGRALHLRAHRRARGAAERPLAAGAAGAPARRQPRARVSTRRGRRSRRMSLE